MIKICHFATVATKNCKVTKQGKSWLSNTIVSPRRVIDPGAFARWLAGILTSIHRRLLLFYRYTSVDPMVVSMVVCPPRKRRGYSPIDWRGLVEFLKYMLRSINGWFKSKLCKVFFICSCNSIACENCVSSTQKNTKDYFRLSDTSYVQYMDDSNPSNAW